MLKIRATVNNEEEKAYNNLVGFNGVLRSQRAKVFPFNLLGAPLEVRSVIVGMVSMSDDSITIGNVLKRC